MIVVVLKSFILIKGGGRGLARGEESAFSSDYKYFNLNNVFVLKKGEVLPGKCCIKRRSFIWNSIVISAKDLTVREKS